MPKRPLAEATGGTERTVLEVAKIQQRRGLQVTVAAKADQAWRGEWENVTLVHLAPSPWLKALTLGKITGVHLPLTSLIYSEKFDWLHFHEYFKTDFFETYPRVMHFHNDPLPGCDEASLAREAPAYWRRVGESRRQIGVSHYVVNRLRRIQALAGDQASSASVVQIPNGVHPNAISSQARAQARRRIRENLALKESDVVFLFVGALRPEKGVGFLARAFLRMAKSNPEARLVVIGGGRLWIEQGWLQSDPPESTEREIAQILAPASESGRALLLGIVPPTEIMPYYAASDVLVLPSMFQETFGLVILEAFSVGLAVLAFRSGGVPELIEHGLNGILVEQGDEDGLLRAMCDLASDPALRKRLGAEGERTVQHYSWEKTVDQIRSLYGSPLSGSSARRDLSGYAKRFLSRDPR